MIFSKVQEKVKLYCVIYINNWANLEHPQIIRKTRDREGERSKDRERVREKVNTRVTQVTAIICVVFIFSRVRGKRGNVMKMFMEQGSMQYCNMNHVQIMHKYCFI